LAALITLAVLSEDWTIMIFTVENFTTAKMANYGYSLGIVYLVWILVIAFLYPFCYQYMKYKLANKDKWWLSYL
jgi:Na+/H+-dicarboxylate symporter